MTKQEAITIGKAKLLTPAIKHGRTPNYMQSEKLYEILGSLDAQYFGYTSMYYFIDWVRCYSGGPAYFKFLKGQLTECTFKEVLASSLYRRRRILIFGDFLFGTLDGSACITNVCYNFYVVLVKKRKRVAK